nr:transposase [Isorropodon fossajaponicum symbiont]
MLKQNQSGISVADLCREYAMSQATFYKWRSKYGDTDFVSMVKRLKELESENAQFKRMYAESELKLQITKDALAKKF